MQGYEHALAAPAGKPSEARPECVRVVMRRAMNRTWKHLARERLQDLKPNIPRGERFWPLSKDEKHAHRQAVCRGTGAAPGGLAEVPR